LEQRLNGNARPLSEAEVRKEWEHDYAEIESLGLVERAYRDFSARLTNATVEAWTIGYLRDTNMVWCEVKYRVPGSETLEQGFGYQRQAGTNWNLVWKDVRSGNQ
jgi:hypothetical protein